MLLKSPSISIVATIALALGIGANTAIFSVVSAVLLRPLPFPDPDSLVAVFETVPQRGMLRGSHSYPNFFDVRFARAWVHAGSFPSHRTDLWTRACVSFVEVGTGRLA